MLKHSHFILSRFRIRELIRKIWLVAVTGLVNIPIAKHPAE